MKRHVWFSGILVLAMAALASAAAGDEKEKKTAGAGPPNEKAAMEAMMKAATPGAPHKKLDAIVGTFDVSVKMWMDPSRPAQESSGKEENRWVLGNRYVEQHFDGTFMGQPFSGIGYAGYDNITKKYIGTWMDTAGTSIMMSTGKADATGKIMTYTGTENDPMTGKPFKVTTKITVADNDHHRMEMWGPDPTGKSYKMMEISYTRKK